MVLHGLLWLLLTSGSTASIFQLAEMITIHTGKEWISYASYGCYCGAGNAGTNVTLDCSDACCEAHDSGYGDLIDSKCNPYWDEYKFTTHPLGCADDVGTCARRLCECDVALVRCLAQWTRTYKQVFVGSRNSYCLRPEKNIDKSQCDSDYGNAAHSTTNFVTPLSHASAENKLHTLPSTHSAIAWTLNSVGEIEKGDIELYPVSTAQFPLSAIDVVASSNASQSITDDDGEALGNAHMNDAVEASSSTLQSANFATHVVLHSTLGNKVHEDSVQSMDADSGPQQQQQHVCSSLSLACRQFSLAELLAWVSILTVVYLLGSILFFYGGVMMGRRKEGFRCEAIPSCCCCAGQEVRYKKLAAGGDIAESLSEI